MEDVIDRIGNHTKFLCLGSYQIDRLKCNSIIHLAVTEWPEKLSPSKLGSKRPYEEVPQQQSPQNQPQLQETVNGTWSQLMDDLGIQEV